VLLPDELTARRAHQGAVRHRFPLPAWLTRLPETVVTSTSVLTDELGDAENINLSLRLAGGEEFTIIVLIDHNMNSVAKDGFLVPGGFADVKSVFEAAAEDGPHPMELIEIDPAEARARLEHALPLSLMTHPPLETDSWPQAMPLVEWAVRMLPTGGRGYDLREWSEEETAAIAAEFLASPEAAHLTMADDPELVKQLLWFTTGYSGGDPLRWSPMNTDILMGDWFPRKVIAPKEYLQRMPTVLEAFVRYSHRIRGITRASTEATLSRIAAMTPDYMASVTEGSGRPWWMDNAGPGLDAAIEDGDTSAMLAALGLPGGDFGSWRRFRAVEMVGSEAALADLASEPLPAEEFDWEGIAEDIRPRVEKVLDLCDGMAQELFDVEYRTAFRPVLARAARQDPAIFRRRSKDETRAATDVWIVAAANEILYPVGELTTKELFAPLGVTGSVVQRARPFVRTYGANEYQQTRDFTLGTPEVLTSATRERLIAVRDSA